MKKWIPWLLASVFTLWAATTLIAPKPRGLFDANAFGRLPVVLGGRIQPMDSMGRNALLVMRGKQSVALDDRSQLSAREWLLEVFFKPEQADTRKVFRIDHPEVLALLHLTESEKYFSYAQIAPQIPELSKQAQRIAERESSRRADPQTRTVFEKQLMKLHEALSLYQRLKVSVRPPDTEDFAAELKRYESLIAPGIAAAKARETKQNYDQDAYERFLATLQRFEQQQRMAYPLVIPPMDPHRGREGWQNMGTALLEAVHGTGIHPAAPLLAKIGNAYRQSLPAEFNLAVGEYAAWLQQKGLTKEIAKGQREFFFNHLRPFYTSMVIYVLAFLLASFSWLNNTQWMNRSAFLLLILGIIIHTSGLVFRMVLEGRPPVTNLYSSAIFVGWGAVLLGMVLEKFYRDGVGNVIASSVGFITLVVAHNLSLDGDTMQMLRAVLDTNFWLATHVVTITIGYSAVFVAGFLAIIYVLRGVLTRGLTAQTREALSRMTYGTICFGTFFSFIGTVLGGIWADQSWGRFWGWDPKENGALLIVLWCAILLHVRWGRLANERVFMALTIFGNVITSFSWFGVNMLGVGLHSYGFMDQAFFWLMAFAASQVLIIAVGLIPEKYWRSLQPASFQPKRPPLTSPSASLQT